MERFWDKVKKMDNGCWEWTACRTARGYGQFRRADRTERAHRVAWSLERGPIPDGVHVLHSCDNPACVNPEHLRLGSHADNMRDASERSAIGRPESLSPEQVAEAIASTEPSHVVAARLGCSARTVRRKRQRSRQ